MMSRSFSPSLLAVAALLLLVGCGEKETTSVLIERSLSDSEKNFKIAESSTQRFRYQTTPAAGNAGTAGENTGGPKLIYDTPEGWAEKPGSTMRDINFSIGENGEAECYVARLPGAGGGLLANVNRWRSQMGAEPLTEEQVAALPTKPLFGQQASFVAVDGSYTPGMGTSDTFENYRLLGLILASDAGAVFVKMTGPKDLVTKNEAAFDQFTQSIDVNLN
ncbi:MAG: hypothetical protein NWT04_04955 [Verrucomicrobiales bacterium]|nr:hypothetical protein [Verrucomicrobiales bacterium]MDP4793105.1 hypothetical protein [Verrucomicrobiales bacterium]MDP5006159.1 hypothetical protein [Verrucomicrobiales bacterium]